MMGKIIPLVLLILGAGIAAGAPITWEFTNTAFNDGGVASGFFVFDANTNHISDWNVATTAGSTLGAFDYTPANSSNSSSASFVQFESNQKFPNNLPPPLNFDENRFLILNLVGPLTNAGGTVGLLLASAGQDASHECLNCNPFRLVVTGALTSVPEPGSLGMLLLATGAFAGLIRRRTSL